ncbi:PIN domain-like protein [Mycena galericulata]|nr:PIN domain-like protein [Mycena galericulata]
MGIPKLWEIVGPAAETRSLLNLATIEGFKANNRKLRTMIIGVDISIQINAVMAALTAAGVLHATPSLILEKLFYQLCNFSLAPITYVFVFDGPGRPSAKRGTRVVHRETELLQDLKAMIVAFGFYYYEAPGEAEAELAQLNENGCIDGIITEDSDALVFGARCVIRTLGPTVQHNSLIYDLEAMENTEGVSLGKDDLLLCALLLGGDYGPGISGAGTTIARALAAHGFGRDLVEILRSLTGSDLSRQLTQWRADLRKELRENTSGLLDKRHPKLANSIPDTFPSVRISNLYLNPLTSGSPHFLGPMPNVTDWRPREPNIPAISASCTSKFGWSGVHLLKKLNGNLWPAVVFRMISSRYVLFNPSSSIFASPSTRASLLKFTKLNKYNPAFIDSSHLNIYRVRVSTDNFVSLAGLNTVPVIPEPDIKLVSIPGIILAVAMRDPSTDLAHTPSVDVSDYSDPENSGEEDSSNNRIERTNLKEEDLIKAHRELAAQGVIDLTT